MEGHTNRGGNVNVVIVGKTLMGPEQLCIGALNVQDWSSLRLFPKNSDGKWKHNSTIEIGQTYEIRGYKPYPTILPHSEDFKLRSISALGEFGGNLPLSISNNIKVARQGVESLFKGCLILNQAQSLTIKHANVPTFSTQFWVPNQDLIRLNKWDKDFYVFGEHRIRYVGYRTPIDLIPAGSLVRLSLARWWAPPNQEESCYLQVSGWWKPPVDGSTW